MPDVHPDPSDKSVHLIRFGCGTVFGCLLAASLVFAFYPSRSAILLVIAGTVVIISGLLAVKFGDRFWLSLRRWLWVFWP